MICLRNFSYLCDNVFICLRKFSDHWDNLCFLFDLSGVTLFDDIKKEELQYMPGDERLMSLCVEYLGVLGVLVVPGVVSLGVTGKVYLWFPSKVFF